MHRFCALLLICCIGGFAGAQTVLPEPDTDLDDLLQRSVVRVWWNRDLVSSGEFFRFAVNGAVIENIFPRFQATYETDAWVYSDTGHLVAYLGPAGAWIHRGALQLNIETADGQSLPAKLIGIDEAQGIAVIQAEATTLRPTPARLNVVWKPYGGYYVASLEKGFALSSCRLLNAEHRVGLEDQRLRFRKLRLGRPGSLVFTREGEFAGFLTVVPKAADGTRTSVVSLMSVEQILPSVQRIIRTGGDIKSGWLGLYLKSHAAQPGQGILVRKVVPGGPAAKAGVLDNDVLVKVNDVPVESLSQVVRMIQRAGVGSALRLDILRGGKTLQMTPALGAREDSEQQATYLVDVPPVENNIFRVRQTDDAAIVRSRNAVFLGMYTSDSVDLPNARGLMITDVMDNTPAAQAGLRKGDVIVQVNDIAVRNMYQYMAALMKNLTAPRIVFRCLRDQNEIQKTISLK